MATTRNFVVFKEKKGKIEDKNPCVDAQVSGHAADLDATLRSGS